MLATLVAIALVVQDQAPLRAASQDSAPRQATLWQGEWLEVRGERQGFIQVYDHRRERPGYVREHQVRVIHLDEAYGVKLVSFEREGRTRVCYDQGSAVAVQLLEGWTELWVFHQEGEGWVLDALAPAATEPSLGYVELAGFSPEGSRVLVAREALVEGRIKSSFQVLKRDTLLPEKSADSPGALGAFQRWSSADWRGGTVAMR